MRCLITVLGVVQGVGFRPYAAQLAQELNIRGTVKNSGGIVKIEAYAQEGAMDQFIRRLRFCSLPAARVDQVLVQKEAQEEVPVGFSIIASEPRESHIPLLPPDLPVCPECLKEMDDPADRRYGYPFISCTGCGPRYSILEAVPYDREHISMKDFFMCPDCEGEYVKMGGRRQHAQTISCRKCGPQLLFSAKPADLKQTSADSEPAVLPGGVSAAKNALDRAVKLLKKGGILALKGVGGYQLACLPDREDALQRLRHMKGREKKPFAVMFPDMECIRRYCVLSDEEEALLTLPSRPIVLLNRTGEEFAPSLCSESRFLGAFLPCTGLHVLLTREAGPLVMTSANRTGEPILTREDQLAEWWEQGEDGPDGAAWNTRRILTPLDDSLMRITAGKPQMLRRSRGFVPMPVWLADQASVPLLAFGSDLKAAFCLYAENRVYPSQYFGDMESYLIEKTFRENLKRMEDLFGIRPRRLVCDLHPGYTTVQEAERMARETGLELVRVQHHHAHAASVMAEHGLNGCIAVIFDGTGWGTDGHVWGGEFLYCEGRRFKRMGHLSEIALCGGDAPARDALLAAACHLAAAAPGPVPDRWSLTEKEQSVTEFVRKVLSSGLRTEYSSSMGRFFDAVSALLGIRSSNSYEGECAIALENAAAQAGMCRPLSLPVREENGVFTADRNALIWQLMEKRPENRQQACEAALGFHEALAGMVLEICRKIRSRTGENRTALSGGVFANVLLQSRCRTLLEEDGFRVYVNEQMPGNDGGICLGQAWLAGGEPVGDKELHYESPFLLPR